MQADILKKCITQQDLYSLKEQMSSLETNTEDMTNRLQKDLAAVNKLEELSAMPSKLKDLEILVLKNTNLHTEGEMKTSKLNQRLMKLEEMLDKSAKITDALSGNKNLDAKTIIESVMSITNEVQISMIHREEF